MKRTTVLAVGFLSAAYLASSASAELDHAFGRKTIKLAAEPMVVGVGDAATLTALLSDKAEGKTVGFTLLSGTATLQNTSAQSNADGSASVVATFSEVGTATFIAKSAGYRNSNPVIVQVLVLSPKVKIDPLVRDGNGDIPNSIAPGTIVELNVTIEPGFLEEGDYIQFFIENDDPVNNGQAEVIAESATLSADGKIQVRGLEQTAVGYSGKLRVVAKKNGEGNVVGATPGFSVCAHPTNFRVDGIYNNQSKLRYGMTVVDRWDTDAASGDTSTLDKIWQIESIKRVSRDNPPWDPVLIWFGFFWWVADPSLLSDIVWFRGTTKADGLSFVSVPDRHRYPSIALDNPPSVGGDVVYHQHFHFACERCRAGYVSQAPTITGSDFVVSFKCFKNEKNEFVVQTMKAGNGAPADGLKSDIEAGQAPSAPSNVGVELDTSAPPEFQVFKITWTDNSDIEQNYRVWYWDGATWQEAPDSPLAPNSQQLTLQFAANTFNPGDTLKVKVRACNWRGASAEAEGQITIPGGETPPDNGGGASNPEPNGQ